MPTQSGNSPIIFYITDKNAFSYDGFRASLWTENGKSLKKWIGDRDFVTFEETEDGIEITLPLTQKETGSFPVGPVFLEAKWIKTNIVRMIEPLKLKVERRFDKSIIREAEIEEE